jgi:hypothetical protein
MLILVPTLSNNDPLISSCGKRSQQHAPEILYFCAIDELERIESRNNVVTFLIAVFLRLLV